MHLLSKEQKPEWSLSLASFTPAMMPFWVNSQQEMILRQYRVVMQPSIPYSIPLKFTATFRRLIRLIQK
jgi:hypothetical protein